MTKSTFESIVAARLERKQVESTLYMPSMYSRDEDDTTSDARDETSPNSRQIASKRSSRYVLQRCLAWSQDDDQEEEERVQGEEQQENRLLDGYCDVFESSSSSYPQQEGINMVKSFGSFHSAVIDATSSMDCHFPGNLGVRPIHWEEQVTLEKQLDSFLSANKKVTSSEQ
jgi:hypothetical protein